MLVAELSHRVGYIFAVVQSIALQTLRNSPDLAGFEHHFLSRIHSLAHTHALLLRSDWRGASLEEILSRELAPFQTSKPRWLLDGPHVGINPSAALTLALIFHELATNAAKYGALGGAGGQVNIAWGWSEDSDGDAPRLKVCWTETGGPAVTSPTRKRFGSRLIAQISRSLEGSAEIRFDPKGLCCTIDIPRLLIGSEEPATYRAAVDWVRQETSRALM